MPSGTYLEFSVWRFEETFFWKIEIIRLIRWRTKTQENVPHKYCVPFWNTLRATQHGSCESGNSVNYKWCGNKVVFMSHTVNQGITTDPPPPEIRWGAHWKTRLVTSAGGGVDLTWQWRRIWLVSVLLKSSALRGGSTPPLTPPTSPAQLYKTSERTEPDRSPSLVTAPPEQKRWRWRYELNTGSYDLCFISFPFCWLVSHVQRRWKAGD